MNTLEKILSLLNSRRLWLLIAQAAVTLVFIAGLVAPLFDREIDTRDLPESEALVDRLMGYAAIFSALLSAFLGIWIVLGGAQELTRSYSERPPGVRDRGD